MEDIFKNKAAEIRVQPSDSTWGKLDSHLQYRQVLRERNRYRASLSIAACVALISLVFNALYLTNFTKSNEINSHYSAHSSLTSIESGEPYHMTSKNLKSIEGEDEPLRKILVKQN